MRPPLGSLSYVYIRRVTALAIGLALAAAAIHGTWNVLVKVSGDPMATLRRGTVVAAVVITPITLVVWLFAGRPSITPAAAGLAALSALLELAYLVLLSAAYNRGELSVVYPIARGSAPLLSVAAGIGLIGERLAPGQLAGVALLLVGILAVTLPQTSGRATVPALLTGVSIAAYSAVDRIGVRLSTPWLYGWLLIVLLAIGVVIWGWGASSFRSEGGRPPSGRWAWRSQFPAHPPASSRSRLAGKASERRDAPPVRWRQATVLGIFMWGGYLLVLAALSIAPLSVVAPVRETAIVAVAVWGVWKLRERKGAGLKLFGAGATLVGVALLAF